LFFVVVEAGLADLFVDDELGGAVVGGEHVEGDGGPGGDGDIAELEGGMGDEEGGLVGAEAPGFVPGDQRSPDFADFVGVGGFDGGAAVIDGGAGE
jgi:hypothetical protein